MANTATPESRAQESAVKAKLKREEIAYKVKLEREETAYKTKLAHPSLWFGQLNEVKFEEEVPKIRGFQELTEIMGVERAQNYSWRLISLIEQKQESVGNEDYVAAIKENRAKVESKHITLSQNDARNLLDTYLTSTSTTGETKAFYLKLVGDYCRYVAASKTGAERREAAKSALLAYKSAQDTALTELAPMHPPD